MNPDYITIHSTANPKSTAQNERDYLSNPNNTNSTGWHYVVDDKEIIEAIPPSEVAYHAGNRVGNYSSIGIEMCESGDRKEVIRKTIELTKYLMNKFNIVESRVVKHYDWTKKNCPRILNYNNWQGWVEFKTLLRSESMTEEQIRKIVNEEINKRNELPVSDWANKMWTQARYEGLTDGQRPQAFATRQEVMGMITKVLNTTK